MVESGKNPQNPLFHGVFPMFCVPYKVLNKSVGGSEFQMRKCRTLPQIRVKALIGNTFAGRLLLTIGMVESG
ncbi:hypothetical protein EBZ80_13880, partial [bacterium]|nr:hypothetical protein [bacterium]